MDSTAKNFMMLLGRVLISLIFIFASADKLIHFSNTAAFVATKGVPYSSLLLIVAGIAEALGSLMILFGWKTRLGALIVFLFIIPVTGIIHNFWILTGENAQIQTLMFMKNLSIMGGLLYVMAFGAGKFSFDGRKK